MRIVKAKEENALNLRIHGIIGFGQQGGSQVSSLNLFRIHAKIRT